MEESLVFRTETRQLMMKRYRDGGGFFLACKDFLENVRPFIPRLRFFFFFFFLKWRLARAR